MTTFTREQLIARANHMLCVGKAFLAEHPEYDGMEKDVELFGIALAAMQQEPAGYFGRFDPDDEDLIDQCSANLKGAFPLYAAPVVPDIGKIRVGRLPTMNQDEYPGLGEWWVQLRTGEDSSEVLARIYGATPQEANNRAEYIANAAMLQGKAEPVSNRDELPLDYLQGHKDGLEWAAQLAEANHPQTGDWLYDDTIELAKAIRRGPDMPAVEAGNSPVVPDGWISCSERIPESDDFVYIWPRPDFGVELHAAQHGKFDKRDAGWYAQVYEQNYGIEYYPITVTHWQPLPAAPQQ